MIEPGDFMDVAWDLVGGTREADWRSAVSRAYYAAFHSARQLLEDCGFEVPQADQAHTYVMHRLRNCGHQDLSQAGLQLRNLRQIRNTADYDLGYSLRLPQGANSVRGAADISALLQQARSSASVRQQITETIKTYERDVLRQPTWRP